jgi:CHAT domain-containing protein
MKRLVLILAALAAVAGAVLYARSVRPVGVLHAVERERPARVLSARLSVGTEYRECRRAQPHPDSIVPRETCGVNGDPPVHLAKLVARAEILDPDSLQAAAQAAVIWWNGKTASLDLAITRLEDALRLGGDPVPLLVDLSGVYLFRAQQMQSLRDLIDALDYAHRALAIDPDNPAALLNAALAAEWFPLDHEARDAWNAYLAVDSTSPWAEEAKRRRDAIPRQPRPETVTMTSVAAAVDSFAAHYPAEARLLGWDTVLPAWGSAVLRDSVARADSLLLFAERLGSALVRDSGDATLAHAVTSIHDARGDAAATRKLAMGHRDFRTIPTAEAPQRGDQVLALNPPSPTLRAWGNAYRAAILSGTPDAASALCDSLLSQTDSVAYPALAARLHWIAGKAFKDRGAYQDGYKHLNAAARSYARIGETENFGYTRHMEGFTRNEQGDPVAGYQSVHQALRELRPHPRRRGRALFDLGMYAARDGKPLAAAVIQEEAYQAAVAAQETITVVDVLLEQARLATIAGTRGRGVQSLDSAAGLIDSISGVHRKRLEALEQFTRATTQVGSIGSSIKTLDSVVDFFDEKLDALWRMQALMGRADLHLKANDAVGARADLDSITAHVRRVSEREPAYHQRSAVIEQARNRFDSLVMLHLRDRRPLDALEALDRGRVSFDTTGQSRDATRSILAVRPGEVALEYALIGNRLLTWVVRDGSMTFVEQRVPRDELLLAIEQTGAMLATSGASELAKPHLRRLYDRLIRPVRNQLGRRDSKVVIIADGELARVPFEALLDSTYLVQDHPLRFAASLADARRPALPRDTSPLRALLVANPAFSQAEHPTLDPLDGADEEVDSLRSVYGDADTLSGENATVDSFRARVPRANVVHYAGHAVFDDTRPERSFLVLAGRGRLPADSVGSWNLSNVRMVVLSACSTLRARQGRSGGFAGLSGELLSAGAGGVVGSLWKVDDELAGPLMLEFHREYATSRDPSQALRKAQLNMLESDDPARRSPAAWAGFRYVGR